jgi:hypothetical protein
MNVEAGFALGGLFMTCLAGAIFIPIIRRELKEGGKVDEKTSHKDLSKPQDGLDSKP